jgi:hypothetical protein
MPSITAHELRVRFSPRQRPVDLTARHAPQAFTPHAALATISGVELDGLLISPDAMPHHYIASATILDLQPTQMVAAIIATQDEIRKTYPLMHRTGWRASSDGLTIFFYAWTSPARTGECVACGGPVADHFDRDNRFTGCDKSRRCA